MHFFKKKLLEGNIPLKATYLHIILLILGCLFINYVVLPFVRSCRYINWGVLGGFTTSILLGAFLHIALISYFIKKRIISIRMVLIIWGIIVLVPELIFRTLYWDATIISLPDLLNRIIMVILICCFFAVKTHKAKIVVAVISFVFILTFFWMVSLD
ncbi:MAG: hypothetical protein LUH22_15225 [Bacteroides sp.]|nr:hypothetical protein [Bacteroides sp.]